MDENAEAQEPEIAEEGLEASQVSISPEELEDLKKRGEERDQYLDLLKRTRADFANYQKRVEEDRKRWGLMAQREILAKLLAASDQCRLAAAKSADDHSVDSLRNALCLVWSEIEKFLVGVGVSPMPAEGEEFDPERHEALYVVEREDVPDATIVQEVVRGYEYKGVALRPAQVVVARRPRPPEQAVSAGASEEGPEGPTDGAVPSTSPTEEPESGGGQEAEDGTPTGDGGFSEG